MCLLAPQRAVPAPTAVIALSLQPPRLALFACGVILLSAGREGQILLNVVSLQHVLWNEGGSRLGV